MWIAVNANLLGNKKLIMYAAQTGISKQEAAGRLVELWTLAHQNAERDGTLRGMDAKGLAVMLGLSGDDARLHLTALFKVGLLDLHGDFVAVHGWEEYQAPWYDYLDKMKKDKLRYQRRKLAGTAK